MARCLISSCCRPLTGSEVNKKQISLFLVDKGLPGFTCGKDQKMMGLSGTSHLEL